MTRNSFPYKQYILQDVGSSPTIYKIYLTTIITYMMGWFIWIKHIHEHHGHDLEKKVQVLYPSTTNIKINEINGAVS